MQGPIAAQAASGPRIIKTNYERTKMLKTRSSQKILSAFVALIFLFNNISYGQEIDSSFFKLSKLAPVPISQRASAFGSDTNDGVNMAALIGEIGQFIYAPNADISLLGKHLKDTLRNSDVLDLIKKIWGTPENLVLSQYPDNEYRIIFIYKGRSYKITLANPDTVKTADADKWEIINTVAFRLEKTTDIIDNAANIDNEKQDKRSDRAEPPSDLIGRGFTNSDVDKVQIKDWSENFEFRRTIDDLKTFLREKAPQKVRDLILSTLESYQYGESGKKLGTVRSFYQTTLKYYLGYGTKKNIALAQEFFDPDNQLLYPHRMEALYHEVFHAAKNSIDPDALIEESKLTHFYALRSAAALFWGLSADELIDAEMHQLEKDPRNGLGESIRTWKQAQSNIPEKMANDDYEYLLRELRDLLKKAGRHPKELFFFLESCDKATTSSTSIAYPVESRYPVLRAVTMLNEREQNALLTILTNYLQKKRYEKYRKMAIFDSILLMLQGDDTPENWADVHAPTLIGKNMYLASSEIWYPGGGLGRVMQYHAAAMYKLLGKKYGHQIKTIEPGYQWTFNKKGDMVPMNYEDPSILSSPIRNIKEVDRFTIYIGNRAVEVIVKKGINTLGKITEPGQPDQGIESYLISDKDAYYTHSLYNYKDGTNLNLPSVLEYTEFISKATVELVRRLEENERVKKDTDYQGSILYSNDSQFACIPTQIMSGTYTEGNEIKSYMANPVFQKLMPAFTTHTYPNRIYSSGEGGLSLMNNLHIPTDLWYLFKRGLPYEAAIYDLASGAIKGTTLLKGWTGGVSRKHVRDVGHIDELNEVVKGVKLIAVTNGDDREKTAEYFRSIMSELAQDENNIKLFPKQTVDFEHPTPEQVLATKKEAKKRLQLTQGQYYSSKEEENGFTLNPDQYVVAYTGRLVPEKAGRKRAFTDRNIEELIKAGVQVVIYGNTQKYQDSKDMEADMIALVNRMKDKGPGKLVFVPRFNLDDQRRFLPAVDAIVLDSDPKTEAAGFSETDAAATGAVVVAPPWEGGEGIIASQGAKIDFSRPGIGNTVIPDLSGGMTIQDAYLKAITDIISLKPNVLASYQSTSVKLSRVLDAKMTGAEYLRQWNNAYNNFIARLKLAEQNLQGVLAQKGSIRLALATIFYSPLRKNTSISVLKDFMPAREEYSETTVRMEMRMLRELYLIKPGDLPGTIKLADELRELPEPIGSAIVNQILEMPLMDRYTLSEEQITQAHETIWGIINNAMGIYKAIKESDKSALAMLPPVEQDKTLWHVIPAELIPDVKVDGELLINKITKDLKDLYRRMPNLKEKIMITSRKQNAVEQAGRLASENPNNIVDIALIKPEDLSLLPEGVRAIVFKYQGGDFVHLEGILAALRALHNPDKLQAAQELIKLHGILADNKLALNAAEIASAINDPAKLYSLISFYLKPITVRDTKELEELHKAALSMLYSA